MTRKLTILLAALALAACGRMGDLERPSPRASVVVPPSDPDENVARTADRQDVRDRDVAPAPPRTLPIGGQGSDPFAVAPQGALPDPYANPQ